VSLESFLQPVVDFVRDHQAWSAPVVFLLAFAESLAFLSLLIPAWGALVGIGLVIPAADIPFWPTCTAGALGAALGDWLSYWFGRKLKDRAARVWPVSRHPDLLPRGKRFMARWGAPGVFIGRFFGPLRAIVPLVAGSLETPWWRFQLANFSSAFVWAWVLLKSGELGFSILRWLS
jgi:membrane protein DedA with SNARE-associated domain